LNALVNDARKLQRSINSLRQSNTRGAEQVRAAQEAPAEELFASVRPRLTEGKFGSIAGSAVGDVFGTTRGRLAEGASDLGSMALLGGAGYLAGGAAGIDPMLGALLGAGSRRGAPFVAKKAGTVASLISPQTAPIAASLAVQGIAPTIGYADQKTQQALQPSVTPDEIDEALDLFDAPVPRAPQASPNKSPQGPSTPTRSASGRAKDEDVSDLFD
jgi:hypothetical protein